jgi:hypothetical protein
MKPPSGFARRKGGCLLTFGLRSVILRSFLNSGTGPGLLIGMICCCCGWCWDCMRLGDLGSVE